MIVEKRKKKKRNETRSNENDGVGDPPRKCASMRNENSNLAIVLNERTYAYTHGIYKAVCFIFLESTSSNRSWLSISFSLSLCLSFFLSFRASTTRSVRDSCHTRVRHPRVTFVVCVHSVYAHIFYIYICVCVCVCMCVYAWDASVSYK